MTQHTRQAFEGNQGEHEVARTVTRKLGKREASKPSTSRVTALDRWLMYRMFEVVGRPRLRLRLWDGTEVTPACDNPVAVLQYRDRAALIKSLLDPELHWPELYCAGRIDFEGDMVEFLEAIFNGIASTGDRSPGRRFIKWLGQRRIFNSQDRARQNIHHHYDISNDFYRLWLDTEAMQYTCAYFPDPEMTLEQAQVAKLHHVCRKLQLKPGDTVVEAGCGWGGLARFMAKNYGVKVRAYNISRAQVKHARERAEMEGLSDRVEYVLDDYRNITGRYDVFVSVGMLEHVGPAHYPELGRVIDNCLTPDGRGLIHTIGRNQAAPLNPWIERRIFPGAHPPSIKEMMDIFEPNKLSVLDVENLRLHYAMTLRHWLKRFNAERETIEKMMDEEFIYVWHFYLCASIAAFETADVQLFQFVFTRAANNQIPWSRDHVYVPASGRPNLSLVQSASE